LASKKDREFRYELMEVIPPKHGVCLLDKVKMIKKNRQGRDAKVLLLFYLIMKVSRGTKQYKSAWIRDVLEKYYADTFEKGCNEVLGKNQQKKTSAACTDSK
jgi:hypothetical protein